METKNFIRRSISYVLLLLLLGGFHFFPLKMNSQSLMDDLAAMEIGDYIGSNLQKAAKAVGEMKNSSTTASMEIA